MSPFMRRPATGCNESRYHRLGDGLCFDARQGGGRSSDDHCRSPSTKLAPPAGDSARQFSPSGLGREAGHCHHPTRRSLFCASPVKSRAPCSPCPREWAPCRYQTRAYGDHSAGAADVPGDQDGRRPPRAVRKSRLAARRRDRPQPVSLRALALAGSGRDANRHEARAKAVQAGRSPCCSCSGRSVRCGRAFGLERAHTDTQFLLSEQSPPEPFEHPRRVDHYAPWPIGKMWRALRPPRFFSGGAVSVVDQHGNGPGILAQLDAGPRRARRNGGW